MDGWFEASKDGLRKLVEDKPKVFVIHELLSNAWDTGCKRVDITLEKVPGRALAELSVVDDHPEGFSNLSHAWTLFAESERKVDSETAGRFNMGEKLVLALCEVATISTTTGTVVFNDEGRKNKPRTRRDSGSHFQATIKMTHAEFDEAVAAVKQILSRPDVVTTFNGEVLKSRDPITTFESTLPTVLGDDGGSLRKTRRKTVVEVYETRGDEVAGIYELGIPVVETGDKYHINVRQKVPLNMDRDNVPPAFKKQLRALVLNNVVEHMSEDDATETWVTEAMGSKYVEPVAVRTAITKRFGEDSVVFDPSDREANHTASAEDFTVVHGSMLPKEVWTNVREAKALKPAGQMFPTHDKYVDAEYLSGDSLTPGMLRVKLLVVDLARELLDIEVSVVFLKSPKASTRADYGSREMRFNVSLLGKRWFDIEGGKLATVVDLIIHELGHHIESSHKSERYYRGLTSLAGKVTVLALNKPHLFK